MEGQTEIEWPDRFAPHNAPVHVRNELTIDAPCASIWAWLVRAELWPTWYSNSRNIRFIEKLPPDLHLGTKFGWNTFGIGLVSTVLEFIPEKKIAWNAKGLGVSAYHVWFLQRTETGCRVVTEETQYGWLARLNNRFRPKNMSSKHQNWLESLADKARRGPP